MEKVSGTLSNVPGIANYESLKDKPQVNGVELSGNKTAKELRLASASQVEQLQNVTASVYDERGILFI